MQLFYNLSDPAVEDALYEIESMQRFAGLRLSGSLPDETTILNFRRLLKSNDLCEVIFQTINQYLAEQGFFLKEGTIVDAVRKHRAGMKNPPFTADEYLDLLLKQKLPETVSKLRAMSLII